MGVCNQVTLLVLQYITSRLVPHLEFIDAPIQVPNVSDRTVSFKFLNLTLKYAFFLFLKCLLTSRLTSFRISKLLWLGFCILRILVCFLWSKKPKHSSSNQGLFCFILCKPRLSFAQVWIFSLMFSQVLFTSLFKFSKAANLFVISIWYCSRTSGSFSFLKLNLCLSSLCAASGNLHGVKVGGTLYYRRLSKLKIRFTHC